MPMGCPWAVRGMPVACAREVHELLVGFQWTTGGLPVGMPMGWEWAARGIPMDWEIHGLPVGFRSASGGLSVRIGCLLGWDADGASVGRP